LRKALLVMHSPVDELVPISEAANIYSMALHPKSFVSLDSADHLLSKDRDSKYAGQVLSAWASRYLKNEIPEAPRVATQSDAVVVASRTKDMFLSTVNAHGRLMLADEPQSHGGTDRGTTPYGFLSAALGTCTAMTLNMYARHKTLPLDQVEVVVKHDRIHAEDCVDCETETGKVDQLSLEIKLSGELDETQRSRLLEIAERCPVHRTLKSEIRIESTLK
jgi:uncharacterized OsmC-like protein